MTKPLVYLGRWICDVGYGFRVKNHPTDGHAVHHGSFKSVAASKAQIDTWPKKPLDKHCNRG